jgi:hypothetical protein
MSMRERSEKTEQIGLRVTKLDRERLEFLARLSAQSPSGLAATLLSEATRRAIAASADIKVTKEEGSAS